MRVFILLFNARTDNEGIHTVREGDRNKILMFESQDDATRFALMLEAQDFPTPTVEEIDSEEIQQFCQSADYDWEIIPENGDLFVPPQINVEETDWQPDVKQEDIPLETSPDTDQASQEERRYSDTELDSIRRRLEGLL